MTCTLCATIWIFISVLRLFSKYFVNLSEEVAAAVLTVAVELTTHQCLTAFSVGAPWGLTEASGSLTPVRNQKQAG